jgi:hypothetical protein
MVYYGVLASLQMRSSEASSYNWNPSGKPTANVSGIASKRHVFDVVENLCFAQRKMWKTCFPTGNKMSGTAQTRKGGVDAEPLSPCARLRHKPWGRRATCCKLD